MRLIKFFAPVFLFAIALAAPHYAVAAQVGENIPHTLKLKDQNGEAQSFETVKGDKGAVLVFVRSADWCSYCQAQLLELSQQGAEIEEHGYKVVSISYDSVENLQKFVTKYRYPYVMLSDEGSEAIKAFGILNEDFPEDSPYYGVPHPKIYVVNSAGVIKEILANEGYKVRPSIEKIVAAIKR